MILPDESHTTYGGPSVSPEVLVDGTDPNRFVIGQFVKIPRKIAEEECLGNRAVTLAVIYNQTSFYAGREPLKHAKSWESLETISGRLPWHRDRVKKQIARLVDGGYLTRQRRPKKTSVLGLTERTTSAFRGDYMPLPVAVIQHFNSYSTMFVYAAILAQALGYSRHDGVYDGEGTRHDIDSYLNFQWSRLMKHSGLSRPGVSKAIQMLEANGLIRTELWGRGVSVRLDRSPQGLHC